MSGGGRPRLIVALTGASGVIHGIRALELLRELGTIETHLVISPAALRTIGEETDDDPERIREIVRYLHSRGVLTKVRNSAGQDVDGGCGQLRARAIGAEQVVELRRKRTAKPEAAQSAGQ